MLCHCGVMVIILLCIREFWRTKAELPYCTIREFPQPFQDNLKWFPKTHHEIAKRSETVLLFSSRFWIQSKIMWLSDSSLYSNSHLEYNIVKSPWFKNSKSLSQLSERKGFSVGVGVALSRNFVWPCTHSMPRNSSKFHNCGKLVKTFDIIRNKKQRIRLLKRFWIATN